MAKLSQHNNKAFFTIIRQGFFYVVNDWYEMSKNFFFQFEVEKKVTLFGSHS